MSTTTLSDKLLERLLIEYKRNDNNGIYASTQKLMAYNSNRIEGNTLSEKQVVTIFYTRTICGEDSFVKVQDVIDTISHFRMFNEMLETYQQPLSHEIIKKYHYEFEKYYLTDPEYDYPIGEYKNRINYVSDFQTALPEDVTDKMTELLSEYNSINNPDLMTLAKLHADYEMIHPFQDGNGRTGRIILYKECLRNKIVPFIIEDKNKSEYYHALKSAQFNEGVSDLYKLFKKEQESYLETCIRRGNRAT